MGRKDRTMKEKSLSCGHPRRWLRYRTMTCGLCGKKVDVNMNRRFITLTLLVLLSLACGLEAPDMARNDTISQNVTIPQKVTNYEVVKFTVTADDLNVRECAGTGCAVIDGMELQRGDTVVCTDFDTPVNGVYAWCKHRLGWSSTQYMEVVK